MEMQTHLFTKRIATALNKEIILITIHKANIVILPNYMFCRLSIILLKKITRFFDRFLLLKIYIESLIKKAYNILKVTKPLQIKVQY